MEKNCKLFHDRWKFHEIQISVSMKFYWNTAMPIHLRFLWLFDATIVQSRNPCLLLKMWIRSIQHIWEWFNHKAVFTFIVVSQRNTRWKQSCTQLNQARYTKCMHVQQSQLPQFTSWVGSHTHIWCDSLLSTSFRPLLPQANISFKIKGYIHCTWA